MTSGLRERVLPETQRRPLEELVESLDLCSGDLRSKRSAFWTMLTLSAVIASAGVLLDSTATVIGAMIIAPLATPIMGIALATVRHRGQGAIGFALLGSLLVIVIGVAFSAVLPASYELLANNQIAGRTSPKLMDLVAALATGLAGAVAHARRDVAAVLPGVAIAISLVPPLAVVGVCLGRGAGWLALGALVLFLSNLLALVLGGIAVFSAAGYAADAVALAGRSRRRTRLTLCLLLVLVVVPLSANTVVSWLLTSWSAQARAVAADWISTVPNSSVAGVDVVSRELRIRVRTPGDLPPIPGLLSALRGRIPDWVPIVVESTRGSTIQAGRVGAPS
ncbi:TIGR00341 family protein [Streptosporangium sp. KLBMP 9127]|nr:TIGR00341 family protein [Streptosporangium sp. KLBMP 9127]